ncbi:hypothetical protein BH708_03890 [Brachybacterium sp. P6-10-X1]|uniref:hypothetical protein n=1 Tax=Brachybacterium sp. P6-10-X1 TaxID=1903186 RepID=UPI0009719F80|nr:hypothetical protein [Brachybacterium sp. P6-10-X1]APX32010.1 hypothetical protein BH708_03890 [Brachybacterium sp. P6-10-X1]
MTAKTKTTKSQSILAAEKSVKDVQEAIASTRRDLEKLEQEQTDLQTQIANGSLVVDTDRLADLTERDIPRKANRLEDLEHRILAAAKSALDQAELDALADDQADGLKAHHDTYADATEAARIKIAEGIAELKAATETWESYSLPIVRRADRAGLTEDQGDPLSRVLVAGDSRSRHLVVDGEDYISPGVHLAVAEAVSAADEHLAGTVARGREARRWGLSVSQIGA